MRRIVCILTALLLCLCLTVAAHAAPPLLVDNADLLTDSEEAALLTQLEQLRSTYQMDIVIVTEWSLGGKSPRSYADDYYDYNGYAEDGVLLLVSMSERDWYVSTAGYGITAVTDAGIDRLADRFLPSLSDGDYADAFSIFAEGCGDLIARANTGSPYRRAPVRLSFGAILFSLIIGIVAACIVTGSMKRQLKTVSWQKTANSYIRSEGLSLTEKQDTFLYRNVTRVARPKDSGSHGGGSHSSSSGHSHGGHGGKF